MPSPAKSPASKSPAAKSPASKTVGSKTATKADAPAKVTSAANIAAQPETALAAVGADQGGAGKTGAANVLRGKDLVALVAEATGTKAKDIRLAVEATLSELGKALDAGKTLNLPPLGRLRVAPGKAGVTTGPMKLKLHRGPALGAAKKQAKDTLAETGQDS